MPLKSQQPAHLVQRQCGLLFFLARRCSVLYHGAKLFHSEKRVNKKITVREFFPERLRRARKQAKIKAKDLASFCGISPSYVSDLEHGKKLHPADHLLEKFSECCGVTIDYLLGLTDDPAPPRTIYGAAADSALAKQVREKQDAFGTQDAERVTELIDTIKGQAPAMVRGENMDWCEEVMRKALDSFVVWCRATNDTAE